MSNRLNIVLCALAGAALFAGGACSDESTSSSSSTSTSSSGSSSSSSTSGTGGNGTGGSGGVDCNQVCNDLFDCGVSECAGGWAESDRDLYINGCNDDGCLATCTATPALAALVDSSDCPGTVATISSANATFKDVCDNGFTPCGAGGGGTGGGGTGGAGGG